MKKVLVSLSLVISTSLSYAEIISDEKLKTYWSDPEVSTNTIVDSMTLEEQIGQLLMPDFRYWGVDNKGNKKPFIQSNEQIENIIKRYHLGSIILFRENLIDTPQTVNLINALQKSRSNLPLFISTDQEGGYVTRLREGTEMPGNMALGATRSQDLAELTGMIHGYELSHLGFNFNFGPVVDVNNNQNNPVIGVRSYSDNPQLVTELANSYIMGIHKYPVLTAIKHFPGHGNVSSDTHFSLPIIPIDAATWRSVELVPFKNTINHSDAVMTAHIIVPSLDNNTITALNGEEIGTPATLSKAILTDILRDELSFNGLIMTDAMDMGAISKNFDGNWAVKQAILAGNDIILMPLELSNPEHITKLDGLYDYLKKEAQTNKELEKRINESAKRVVLTKLKNKISADEKDIAQAKKIVASPFNKNIEDMVTENAITLIKNEGVLPYSLKGDNNLIIFSDEKPRNELIKKHLANIANQSDIKITTQDHVVKMMADDLSENEIEKIIKGQDFVLLATYNLALQPKNAQKIINIANKNNVPLVVISTRNPYDIAYLENVNANIAIYGITGFDVTNNVRNSLETNIRGGLNSLLSTPTQGVINTPKGKLPVNIKSPEDTDILYPYGHGLSY
ncbi:glycoside hydrolase family 3 protein [Providencia sp. PROV151]|uniref:glycoside hydrolase family 3 protein n=1 Tax=Providencia sp. PROV151 TaxID=2949861 RepID=UPI00234976F0|nr:glycoside hydrolase family 3 protein [Providencia sp. PROV151]